MYKLQIPDRVVNIDFMVWIIDRATKRLGNPPSGERGQLNANLRTEVVTFCKKCCQLALEGSVSYPNIQDSGWRQRLSSEACAMLKQNGLDTLLTDTISNTGEKFPEIFRSDIAGEEFVKLSAFASQTAFMCLYNLDPHQLDTLQDPGSFSVALFE